VRNPGKGEGRARPRPLNHAQGLVSGDTGGAGADQAAGIEIVTAVVRGNRGEARAGAAVAAGAGRGRGGGAVARDPGAGTATASHGATATAAVTEAVIRRGGGREVESTGGTGLPRLTGGGTRNARRKTRCPPTPKRASRLPKTPRRKPQKSARRSRSRTQP